MVVRIDLSGFGSVTDASELLATYLKEGFAIVSSAATRDSGFNRDTLYYTLVK